MYLNTKDASYKDGLFSFFNFRGGCKQPDGFLFTSLELDCVLSDTDS